MTLPWTRRSRTCTRGERGFTLIELLVTILLIGILASITVRMLDAKKAAYVAVMKSDLRNVVTAQISYFDDNLNYAAAVNQLTINRSPNVTLLMIGNGTGFTVRAMHQLVADRWCAIFMGDVAPDPVYQPAVAEGVMACGPKGLGGGGGKGK